MSNQPDANTRAINRNRIIVYIIGGIFGVLAALIAANKLFVGKDPALVPLHETIGYVDSTGWVPFTDDKGSQISTDIINGHEAEKALELSYNLVFDGWVGMSKALDPEQVFSANKVSFTYRGSGTANTIEVKIVYKPDDTDRSYVFSQMLPGASGNNKWETVSVSFNELSCWEDTGCQANDKIDPLRIWKLDIAISNKFGDTSGPGTIEIENIHFSE